ncbi:MAG: hypothetical protein HC836_36375 [Richelia sp. RM2_1_2]|nr:hypothetical protein [Richelia sp. RM2_1_2]
MKTLSFSSETEKRDLFESLKTTGLSKLNDLRTKGIHEDKIVESISKINNMSFNEATITEDVMNLNALTLL